MQTNKAHLKRAPNGPQAKEKETTAARGYDKKVRFICWRVFGIGPLRAMTGLPKNTRKRGEEKRQKRKERKKRDVI